MRKFITMTACTLLLASAAYAADPKPAGHQCGMMKDGVMHTCDCHMQGGKMMDGTPKDVSQCHEMMQHGAVQDAKPSDAPKGGDHTQHHPAQ